LTGFTAYYLGGNYPRSQSKIRLAKGYGIASDYFSEAIHTMRKASLMGEVSKY